MTTLVPDKVLNVNWMLKLRQVKVKVIDIIIIFLSSDLRLFYKRSHRLIVVKKFRISRHHVKSQPTVTDQDVICDQCKCLLVKGSNNPCERK